MSVSAADLERILQAGENLPLQEYLNLYNKVKSGGTLTPIEAKRYKELHEEIAKRNTPPPEAPAAAPAPTSFKNALEIETYLTAPGRDWKVKKSTIYNHINARKLMREADGTITLKEVERWLLAENIKKADGSPTNKKQSETDKLAREAAEYRRDREKAQARMLQIKVNTLEGELVPRDAFESELAGRAAIFRADMENFFRAQVPAIVNIVSGSEARIPELMAFCIDHLERYLSRYLQKEEFKVDASAYEKIFERADKDETDESLTGDDDEN